MITIVYLYRQLIYHKRGIFFVGEVFEGFFRDDVVHQVSSVVKLTRG